MDGLSIHNVLKKHKSTKHIYRGVYSVDCWPSVHKYSFPQAYVFNTASVNKKGEHWIFIYFKSKHIAEFYDSFGYSPKFYKLHLFFNSINTLNTVIYNSRAIQPILSLKCGLYAIFFAILKSQNISMNIITTMFNSNQTMLNDTILINQLERVL